MQIWANIFLIITGLGEILIKFSKSFLNPGHEFFLHNVAGNTHGCELFRIGFGENIAIEAVIFLIMEK
jgi:hypothetical protein